jgi:hypothetical protein
MERCKVKENIIKTLVEEKDLLTSKKMNTEASYYNTYGNEKNDYQIGGLKSDKKGIVKLIKNIFK